VDTWDLHDRGGRRQWGRQGAGYYSAVLGG
jgi:hypothetical protein